MRGSERGTGVREREREKQRHIEKREMEGGKRNILSKPPFNNTQLHRPLVTHAHIQSEPSPAAASL